jgi:(p)ppGpp synthase/HD superfamily hydrolase
MNALDKALRLALVMHDGQTYDGESYFSRHVLDVLVRTMEITDDIDAHVVAVTHDLVEDTSIELDHIESLFGLRIRDAVDAISKRPGESYDRYLDRVAADDLARLVKIVDLKSNLEAGHSDRYLAALDRLEPTPCDLVRGPDGEFVSGYD